MFKKFLALLLAVLLLFSLAACTKEVPVKTPSDVNSSESEPQISPYIVNPLTGIEDLPREKNNLRPVAIMIDNDSNAQRYAQSGISEADIVYETETEGGITRLMAVFQDIESAPQIGDIRSARYVYVDLAMGHNAIYVHHGKDPDYCAPHLKDLDNFEIGENSGAWRKTYGDVFSWQTLFSSGEKIAENLKKKKWKMTQDENKPWQTFAAADETITLTGGAANKLTAAFNSSYKTYFTYDASLGKYIKTSNKVENKDRNSDAKYVFENVFILQTDMSYYGNQKYRRDIDLSSGVGYYAVNGTYEKIKWKKGKDSDPLVFTKEDGTPLTLSAGNTWVCFIKKEATITVE